MVKTFRLVRYGHRALSETFRSVRIQPSNNLENPLHKRVGDPRLASRVRGDGTVSPSVIETSPICR
jgi:hypothetical protein